MKMTVKELKEMLAKADDNAKVCFYRLERDRDDWWVEREVEVRRIKIEE